MFDCTEFYDPHQEPEPSEPDHPVSWVDIGFFVMALIGPYVAFAGLAALFVFVATRR